MFCSPPSPRLFSLLGALLFVACAAPRASAGVARTGPASAVVTSGGVAGSPAPARSVGESTDSDRVSGIEWRFHTGSSIHASPAVGADGTTYVGTGDGYVQGVGRDGTLRWSYTVEGAVAWSPILDATDHVIVATTAQRLYSISPSGLIAWEVHPPVHVTTELLLAPPFGFVFGATDGSLWAYSTHGAALWHTPLGGTITGVPSVRGNHSVVGGSDGQLWFLDGASKHVGPKLDGGIRGAPSILGDGSVVVLAGTTLVRVDSRGDVLFRREGIDLFGARKGGLLAIDTAGGLVAMTEDGKEEPAVPLPAKASAAPVEVLPDVVCVASETGDLLFVGPRGSIRRVAIARSALQRPVLDAARGRVVVAAGSGTVAAVKIAE